MAHLVSRLGLAAVCTVALAAGAAVSLAQNQPEKKPPTSHPAPGATAPAKPAATAPRQPDAAKPAMTPPTEGMPSMENMMKMWEDANKTGEHHKHLNTMAGDWTTAAKFWMAPGAPPETSAGTAKNTWVLDNRYLQQEYSGDMMGKPFRGMGHLAYNNGTQKYESTWLDSMSTGIMFSSGTCSADGKTMTFACTYTCPMRGEIASRQILRVVGPDQYVFEMHEPGPDGKEYKHGEITYNRKK